MTSTNDTKYQRCPDARIYNVLEFLWLLLLLIRIADCSPQVMATLRKQTSAGQRNRGGLRFLSGKTPPRLGTSVDEGGVVEYFFGRDGKQCLTLEAFQRFMAELQAEVKDSFLKWTEARLILKDAGFRRANLEVGLRTRSSQSAAARARRYSIWC